MGMPKPWILFRDEFVGFCLPARLRHWKYWVLHAIFCQFCVRARGTAIPRASLSQFLLEFRRHHGAVFERHYDCFQECITINNQHIIDNNTIGDYIRRNCAWIGLLEATIDSQAQNSPEPRIIITVDCWYYHRQSTRNPPKLRNTIIPWLVEAIVTCI